MPFDRIQCAELAGWDGAADFPGWRKVAASVADLAGGPRALSTPARPTRAASRFSICVLPFANISDDPQQEYFSDGISEDIITDLSKVSALSVVSRNTAFTFKGKSFDVPHIARQLGVSHVLEGSVRKAGNRVRITAQLIDATADDHIWAERYDRDLTDIFALQDEISEAIVKALKLRLLPEEKKAIEQRGTTNLEAYNLYLMAQAITWVVRQRRATRGTEGDRDLRLPRAGRRRSNRTMRAPGRSWRRRNTRFASIADGRATTDWPRPSAHCSSIPPWLSPTPSKPCSWPSATVAAKRSREMDPSACSWTSESDMVNSIRPASLSYLRPGSYRGRAIRYFAKAAALNEADSHSPAMLQSACTAIGDGEGARAAARMALSPHEKILWPGTRTTGRLLANPACCAWAILDDAVRTREWIDRALLIDPDNMLMRYNPACAP